MMSKLVACVSAVIAVGLTAAPAAAGGSLKYGGCKNGSCAQQYYAQPASKCCAAYAAPVVHWERQVVYQAVPVVKYQYQAVPVVTYQYQAVPYNRCCNGWSYGYAYTGYGCR